MNRTHQLAFAAIVSVLGAGVWSSLSQDGDATRLLGERPVKDFVIHDDDFMIKGDRAFLQPNQLVRLEGIVVETRREGMINLTITTPTSVYDPGRTNVRSTDSIEVQSADDRFLLSGRGYSFFPKSQQLTFLSNVVTRFDRSFFADAKGVNVSTDSDKGQLSVTSDEFFFDGWSGDAEYRQDVLLSDGEGLALSAGMLRLNISALTNEVREVRAIQDVTISLETTNGNATASGHEAILSTEPGMDGQLTLVGQPTWEQGLLSGKAGMMQLIVISNQFDILGTNQASMRFPSTLFDTNQTQGVTNALQWIDIESDHYRLTQGMLAFHDGVVVEQSTNWTASSRQMLVHLNPTNRQPTRLDALGDFQFVVNQEQGRGAGRADQAEFKVNDENHWLVLLSGSPRWTSPEMSTTARTINVVDPMGNQEVVAEGDATLTLSSELLAGMNWFSANTNAPKSDGTRTNMGPVTITSREYDLNAERVVFTGDVLVSQSTNSLAAPTMTIWFTEGRRARKLYAERGVTAKSGPHTLFAQTLTALFEGPNNAVSEVRAMEDVDFRDVQVRASGKTLIYEAVSGEVVLDGDPIVIATKVDEATQRTRRVRMDAPSITMNLTNHTVVGSAPFTIRTLPSEPAEERSTGEPTHL